MAGSQSAGVTPADIQSVGEKLEEFRQGLPAGEQAALAWLIQRAAMAPSEDSMAAGYAIVFAKAAGISQEGSSGKLPFEFETTWSLGETRS